MQAYLMFLNRNRYFIHICCGSNISINPICLCQSIISVTGIISSGITKRQWHRVNVELTSDEHRGVERRRVCVENIFTDHRHDVYPCSKSPTGFITLLYYTTPHLSLHLSYPTLHAIQHQEGVICGPMGVLRVIRQCANSVAQRLKFESAVFNVKQDASICALLLFLQQKRKR